MRLNQITIHVSNIEVSKAFYLKLGFRLLVDSPHYTRFMAPEGDTTFSLHITDDLIVPCTVIYLECDHVDETVKSLQALGVLFESEPCDESWLWREAILRDPDGHHIKIYHAGENRTNPPWRVNSAKIET